MRDESDAMRALMGFASFGRPRKRVRRGGGGSASDRLEVHHVVPHTAVQPDDERVPASRLRVREHGIAMLLHPGNRQKAAEKLELHDSGDEREKPRQTEPHAADGAGWWSLPSRSQALVASVGATKARFELLEAHAFALARRRANPYEPLGRHRFINRSAMKMANLDFLFQWTQRVRDSGEAFVFADVCGGPGGFSEYLLWRCKGTATTAAKERPLAAVGFGITLKGAPWCDWKVNCDGGNEDTGTVEFHICDGADGTGDLYKIANIDCFRDTLRNRYLKGAHLVVADGGFPDARDQSNQELIMTRLVFAETLTMFGVLQIGGSFLCKTFELSSPLMLQLFWLLHNCFEEITIVKPVTSRPASSERYIVAQSMLPELPLQAIQRELSRLVASLESKDPQHEALQLVDAFPSSSKTWLEFVAQASDRHAKQQIQSCERIIALASPPTPQRRDHRPPLRIDSEEYYRAWGL